MNADTWKPAPQKPCPCSTCTSKAPEPEARPVPVVNDPELRECGVTGCTHCKPVAIAGGGDRLPFGRA